MSVGGCCCGGRKCPYCNPYYYGYAREVMPPMPMPWDYVHVPQPSHSAVKCPVCEGEGGKWTNSSKIAKHQCHGCGGKGWIVV